ncbi:sulfatase [Novipirellula artificiosorum]|uniref:Arylsulfatase n=1 Tax=Novipirellula artificiosorum TaxID=2528016 RepID=A0A5C6D5Q3_9BACT|nr:sulfatase [Novipirellula artificiosorum]TWU31174.1 Arylsulfatase [Novipirellula artificiosorum]
MMKNREFQLKNVCLGLFAALLIVDHNSHAVDRPNVLFILADDLGYHDLGVTGSDLHQTPHIDRLASESVAFTQAYNAPTCSPTRAALLSGKNPATLGIVGHGGIRRMDGGGEFLASEEYTLAEALRDAGYATCHIGKWHVGNKGTSGPAEQGFEEVIASNEFCCPGSFFFPFRDPNKSGRLAERSAVPDLEDRQPGDHLTSCLGEEAVKFLKRQKDADRPFFLNLWYYAVHTPIQAQKDKVEKYRELIDDGAHHTNPHYAGLVEHLDDSVGSVLQALEDNGLADKTLVIFYSDNGGEVRQGITSNHPLRSGKTSLYEGGIRVPLFIRWPGVTRAGAACAEPVVGHDLYPTLLSVTGAAGDPRQNREMDGRDLSGLLRDPSAKLASRSLHWLRYGETFHYPSYRTDPIFGPSAAIRKGDWKMVERYPTPAGLQRKFELYQLVQDPSESVNLAESNPGKLMELRNDLVSWQRKINIPTYESLAWPAFEKVEESE